MAKKRRAPQIFNYECSITNERFKTTKQAKNPDELVSIRAFYEMTPEMDDRPEHIKKEQEQLYAELDEENGGNPFEDSTEEEE